MIGEPARHRLLERDKPGAAAPMEGATRSAHQAEDDQHTFPWLRRRSGDMHDLMVGHARRQADGAAKAAAAAAHMTFRGAAHGFDPNEWRAINHPHSGIVGPA